MKFLLSIPLAGLLLLAGCATKPGAPVSPVEQILADNAVISASNRAVASALMGLQQQGLISTPTAAPILSEQYRIAAVDQQLLPLLQAPPAQWNYANIRVYLQQIKSTADNLVSHGLVGITNPASQQTISRNLDTVTTIADQMLALLQSLQPTAAGK